MKKILIFMICLLLIISVGCENQQQSHEPTKIMDENIEKHFYKDGSGLIIYLSDVITDKQEYDKNKVVEMYDKYKEYKLNEKQDKFRMHINLCVKNVEEHIKASKEKNTEYEETTLKLFEHDMNEALKLIQEFNSK